MIKKFKNLLAVFNIAGKPEPDKFPNCPNSFFDIKVRDIDGNDVNLNEYKNSEMRAYYITNVASKWGLTDKYYKQMVELDKNYRKRGLQILAFPCNQFGEQEPGSSA